MGDYLGGQYGTCRALWLIGFIWDWYSVRVLPIKRTRRSICDYKSVLLENAASLYAIVLKELLSSNRIRIDVFWPVTNFIVLFKYLRCMLISFSYIARVTCENFKILRGMSGLVFACHASFILLEANLLNSAFDGFFLSCSYRSLDWCDACCQIQ